MRPPIREALADEDHNSRGRSTSTWCWCSGCVSLGRSGARSPDEPMDTPSSRKPALTTDQRRALSLLASSRDGYPEALFLAHGFTAELIDALVAVGLVVTKRTQQA